jgi:hypothetical protein
MDDIEQWAACPEVDKANDEKSPRFFDSEDAATKFLRRRVPWTKDRFAQRKQARQAHQPGQLFPQYLIRRRNEESGWRKPPIPVRRPKNLAGSSVKRFQDVFPPQDTTEAPEQNIEVVMEKVWDGSFPEPLCALSEEWNFPQIRDYAKKLSGHQFEGRKNADGIPGIVSRAVCDFRTSMDYLWPHLSPRSIADFYSSWDLWRYVAEFCQYLGKTETAKTICRHDSAWRKCNLTRDVIYGQLLSYAYEIAATTAAQSVIVRSPATSGQQPQKPAARRKKTGAKRKRTSSMIESPVAVNKLEQHLTLIRNKGGTVTRFLSDANISERTLRSVRVTKKARPDTFQGIAKAMNVTYYSLLNE